MTAYPKAPGDILIGQAWENRISETQWRVIEAGPVTRVEEIGPGGRRLDLMPEVLLRDFIYVGPAREPTCSICRRRHGREVTHECE